MLETCLQKSKDLIKQNETRKVPTKTNTYFTLNQPEMSQRMMNPDVEYQYLE
jgi:hypothetical protein